MTSTKLSICVFSAILLSACGEKSGKEYIDIASQHQSDGNYQAASIALKNAIKQDRNNTEAREMLGVIYLHQGLYSAAEKELSRATSDSSKVGLAESLLWQEKHAEIRELTITGSQEKSEVSDELEVYKAIALFREGNKLKALEKFASLAENANKPETSNLADAYLAGLNNNIEKAISSVNKSLASRPNYLPALQLKSKIEIQQKLWSNAIDTLKSILQLRAADYKIKLQLADTYINNGDYLAAEPLINQLLKISQEQPYFNQLKGTIEFSKANFQQALVHLDKAIKNGRSNTTSRLLAALTSYNLGQVEQAYQNLSVIIDDVPKSHFAYKLFSVIQLQLGYAKDASETLGSISDLSISDTSFIIQASDSLLKSGDSISAKLLLNQIDSKKIENSEALRTLGSLKILADDQSGVADLERSYTIESDSSEALFILASAYLDMNDFEKTLELTNEWLEKKPNDVAVMNLQARTYNYMQKPLMAEEIYKDSLAIDTANPAALLFLIEQNIKRDNFDGALQYLETLVNENPLNINALVKYFQVHELLGHHERALVPMQNALKTSDDLYYDLIYVGSLASQKKIDEQLTHLLSIKEQGKNEPKYWMLLGDAYWGKGDKKKGAEAYANWLDTEKSFNAYVKNIRVAETTGNLPRAMTLINKAISVFPNQRELDLILTQILLSNNNFDRAQKVLTDTTEENKATASGLSLQGRLWLVEKEYKKAEDILYRSYNMSPNTHTAHFLYTAIVKQDNIDEAITFAESHLTQNPDDTAVRLMLANQLLAQEQPSAIEHYEYLASNASPESPLVLNNLAWMLVENNRGKEALNYIKQALALLPDNPTILSTAGVTYASLGDYDQAITMLKTAFEKAPSSFEIGLDYVKALHKSGNNDYAKIIFKKLAPKAGEQQREASALFEQLEE